MDAPTRTLAPVDMADATIRARELRLATLAAVCRRVHGQWTLRKGAGGGPLNPAPQG